MNGGRSDLKTFAGDQGESYDALAKSQTYVSRIVHIASEAGFLGGGRYHTHSFWSLVRREADAHDA